MTRGFTLIEMIVYVALLTLVMGGTLAATYELLSGQGRASGHNTTEEEGSFVLGKFAFAMGQITATSTPSIGSPNTHTLDITTTSGPFKLCLINSAIRMSTTSTCSASSGEALTTSNVRVTGLDFIYLPAVGSGPDGIVASTTLVASTTAPALQGETFRMTRYLRK
jgi:prepilin-type N-terminal cleavage/methylation domain-containing protein